MWCGLTGSHCVITDNKARLFHNVTINSEAQVVVDEKFVSKEELYQLCKSSDGVSISSLLHAPCLLGGDETLAKHLD